MNTSRTLPAWIAIGAILAGGSAFIPGCGGGGGTSGLGPAEDGGSDAPVTPPNGGDGGTADTGLPLPGDDGGPGTDAAPGDDGSPGTDGAPGTDAAGSDGAPGTDAAGTYTVGGTISGLAGTVILQDNAGDNLSVSANGSFTFATPLATGASYNVTVLAQPTVPAQTCTVSAPSGVVGTANVTGVVVTCITNAFTVGGTLSGLAGGSVVLQDNAGDNLTLNANGTFAFATPVLSGATYAVTVLTQPGSPAQTCTVSSGSGTVGSSNVTTVAVACSAKSYTVGGTVSGMNASSSIVLQDNGGDDLTLSANGPFTFTTPVASGAGYAVTIKTQPAGQTCTVSAGTGTVGSGNVTSVVVNCAANAFTVGGTISGLGGSVILQDNGGDDLTLSANGTFAFSTPLASGSPYVVTVKTQPTGQTCTVTNGTGVMAASNVTSVTVACTTAKYTIGGTISGLSGSVVLQDNGGDNLTLSANGGFTFPTSLATGASYNVSVLTQPGAPSQTCTVSGGSGTVGTSNVTNVSVACKTNSFTIGGTLSGLAGTIVLADNGGDDLTLTANGGFTFATPIASGATYAVTVKTQPAGQTCTVSGGTGTVGSGNVGSVVVNCGANTYTVGGTISGLVGNVVLQDNGGDNLTLNANGSFAFATPLANASTYLVTVAQQPTGQTCVVTSGSGTVAGANVTSVAVACGANKYTIGGTLIGLGVAGSVVLQDNGGNNLTLTANGTFTFTTALAYGASYNVTVLTQPLGQTCTVSGGSGQVGAGNVTSVVVNCAANMYTVGGTISGLTGTIILQDNGGDNLTLNANGTFAFSNPLATNATYAVTILTQPKGESCVVANGSGTVGTSNVSNVTVTCTTTTFTIGGGLSGLPSGASVTLQDNGGNNLTLTANGSFSFTQPVAYGGGYNVTVLTQPLGSQCTVSNGTGTATANVTNVTVVCAPKLYSIGGNLSGLGSGKSVTLQDNGGDNLVLTASGGFTFATGLAHGTKYAVTVLTQPAGQTCTVTAGTGTVAYANVVSVQVACH